MSLLIVELKRWLYLKEPAVLLENQIYWIYEIRRRVRNRMKMVICWCSMLRRCAQEWPRAERGSSFGRTLEEVCVELSVFLQLLKWKILSIQRSWKNGTVHPSAHHFSSSLFCSEGRCWLSVFRTKIMPCHSPLLIMWGLITHFRW